MSDITVDVECAECGRPLDAYSPRVGILTVSPCSRCMDAAEQDGYRSGRDDAAKASGGDG
jgi:hypothetical protein